MAPVHTYLSAAVIVVAALPAAPAAQVPAEIARQRAEYLAWLETAPNSPLAALAQQPVGAGLRLGPPDADIPLEGLGEHRVRPRGRSLELQTPTATRPVVPGRPVQLGPYTLAASNSPRGPVATVFHQSRGRTAPGYYDYDPAMAFTGPLIPPDRRARVRVLAEDGLEMEATEAGSIVLPLGGRTRLRVLRIPTGHGEESDLQIFFRDESNGRGSYPAGRFVNLLPLADGRYRVDFNQARNPFCAYSSVYPCPAPWRGNHIAVSLQVGERYTGGGLDTLPELDAR